MSDTQSTDELERRMLEMLGNPKPESDSPAGFAPLSDDEIDSLLLVQSAGAGASN
ncbi:hypothetical protein Pla123a_23530 [Posidoniimonas polymericola]|uniref:Uncharacterized protein n=1 Tax=Posidoniimonas polymericola TaxID=2528002 RepID=A0A5C5YQ62_9BACT|nr:hypothetical protein [Posidoniimonas polymericola]TWT76928.1 hypothetical protein Pla123a_23530 [Posidoniimonas polymericola]